MLFRKTELNRLVSDAVVARESLAMIVFVEEDLDRDALRIGFATGCVRAAMSAEGALADSEISRVTNDFEFDWSHLSPR